MILKQITPSSVRSLFCLIVLQTLIITTHSVSSIPLPYVNLPNIVAGKYWIKLGVLTTVTSSTPTTTNGFNGNELIYTYTFS